MLVDERTASDSFSAVGDNRCCCFRGCCGKRVFVSWPLHVCLLPGGDRCVDSGAKGIHLQGTSLRPVRAQLQHQADGPQNLTGASWDIYVSVWREYLLVCLLLPSAPGGSIVFVRAKDGEKIPRSPHCRLMFSSKMLPKKTTFFCCQDNRWLLFFGAAVALSGEHLKNEAIKCKNVDGVWM